MAIGPRDIPFDRSTVQSWVSNWQSQPTKTRGTLEAFVRAQVQSLIVPKLSSDMVNVPTIEGMDQVHIADLIVSDLPSYLP